MKVRALRIGFFDHIRRREGDVFTIPDQPRRQVRRTRVALKEMVFDEIKGEEKEQIVRFLRPDVPEILALADDKDSVPVAAGSWMERVDARTPEQTSTAQQALTKTSDEIKAGKAATRKGGATGDAEVI